MKSTSDLREQYNDIIKQNLISYYKKKTMHHREIDQESLHIQPGKFTYNGASYCIDISHRCRLSFTPYASSFKPGE